MYERFQDSREKFLDKLEAGVNRDPAFGPLSLDLETRMMRVGEKSVKLTNFEYQIMWSLVRAQGNPLRKSEIEDFLYEDLPDDKDLPLSNTVEVLITRLREKLKDISNDVLRIDHRHGYGYSLEHNGEHGSSEDISQDSEAAF